MSAPRITSLRSRGSALARNDVWLVLGGIVLLAILLRFVAIGSRLTNDEGYSWFIAASPNPHVFLDRLAASENTPPLSYLLLVLLPGQPPWLRVPAAIPGVLMCVVLFYALRARLGTRPSLVAALVVAVSPYLVTYSDLARGFVLADLALLCAVWALLSLAERESATRWALFVIAGVVAVWTEYASAVFLVALVAAAVWLGRPRRRSTILAGGLALLSLAPWIPEIVHGQHQIGLTKFDPLSATPSLPALRDMAVTLALGENGGTGSSAGRWLEFAVMIAGLAAAVFVLRRGWQSRDARARYTIQLLVGASLLTLVGYALASVAGVHLFSQRYITILIPLVAALAAAALASVGWRWALLGAAGCLVALGLVGVLRRYDAQFQPDLTPVRRAAVSMHPRTILTNTPVVLYYLRSLRPQFDRPYNIGPGRAQSCLRPCLAVDDDRVPGGTPRPAAGKAILIGPYVLTLEP